MRRLFAIVLLLTACATTQPTTAPPTVPEWDVIPAGIPSALCQRLQMDGVGTMSTEVSIVKITQPVAIPQALAKLGKPKRQVAVVHRGIPVATVSGGAGGCTWKPIDALDPSRQHDTMVVELSAPVANPASRNNAAGIVARVSLGGVHPSWYWIELIPAGGRWAVGRILPLLF